MILFGLSVPSILLIAIALSAIVVYLPFLVVAYARIQIGYTRDLQSAPRAAIDKLPPFGQRATWAHQNSWEAFSLFSIAALMAYVTKQDSTWVLGAAIAFIPVRILFSVFYILDVPILRSLMFGLGSICIWTLIGSSILGSMN